MRERLPILHEMEGIPHFWSLVGTGTCVFRWWWPADTLQRTASTLKPPLSSYHGLLWAAFTTRLLSGWTWVEIQSPVQPDMGDLWWIRRHKRNTGVQHFPKTSPRIRSPPNHLKESWNVSTHAQYHPSDRSAISCTMTDLSPSWYDDALTRRARHHVSNREFCSPSCPSLRQQLHLLYDVMTLLVPVILDPTPQAQRWKTSTRAGRHLWPTYLLSTIYEQMEPLITAYRCQARAMQNHPYSCTPPLSPLHPTHKATTLPPAMNLDQ